MELIRPLYCVNEEDIIAWKNANNLKFLQCACRFTEACEINEDDISPSARLEVKNLLKKLKKSNPEIEQHIFSAIHNVNLDTFVGIKENGIYHDFNEIFENKKLNKK